MRRISRTFSSKAARSRRSTAQCAPTVSASNARFRTSSPATTGSTFIIDSAPVANTSAPTNTLEFQLSRIGATIGTLNVYMDDGAGTFNLLATYTGPDANQSQGGTEWSAENLDLTNGGTLTVPANIVIRFEYTYGGSFTGDLAIDAFCLK